MSKSKYLTECEGPGRNTNALDNQFDAVLFNRNDQENCTLCKQHEGWLAGRCVRALWQSAGWSNLEGFTACFLAALAAYVGSFCMEQLAHVINWDVDQELNLLGNCLTCDQSERFKCVAIGRALRSWGGIGDSHLWKMASVVIILHISTSADICGQLNYVLREMQTCSGCTASCAYSRFCLMQGAYNVLFVFGSDLKPHSCSAKCFTRIFFLISAIFKALFSVYLSFCSFLSYSTMYRGVCPWSMCVSWYVSVWARLGRTGLL